MLKFLMLGVSSLLLGPSWWGRLSLWCLGALACAMLMPSVYPEYGVGGSLVGSSLRTSLIGLSFWILAVIVMGSGPFKGSYPFLISLSFLLLFLVLSFSLDSLLGFYVSFEASLIPTLVLVLGWGYQPERVQAGVYMMFYTLLGSLPLLLILVSFKEEGSSSMISGVPMGIGSWWWMMGALAFFMKLPMFSVHLWLPKAHVEAPAAGSMILAGVLLKLGGYGLICLVDKAGLAGDVSVGATGLGLMGGCLIGLVCLAQSDMKSLVAYSSVAHMSLCLAGALVFNSWGVNGTLTVMLGHGLCSSGLFYLVNLVYLRSNSRSMLLSKGGVNFIPTLTLWWFLFCVSNMAAPPTLNLLGEVQLMVSLMGWEYWSGVSLFTMALGGGAYSLFLFYSTQHGAMSEAGGGYPPMSLSEGMTLLLHWVPLNLLFLKSEMVVSVI